MMADSKLQKAWDVLARNPQVQCPSCAALRADNERLRAALKSIREMVRADGPYRYDAVWLEADAALAESPHA